MIAHSYDENDDNTLDQGLGIIDDLQELLKVYERNWKSVENRIVNSWTYSSLFEGEKYRYNDDSDEKKLSKEGEDEFIQHLSSIRDAEKSRRYKLDEEIARMKDFDSLIFQSRRERDTYEHKFKEQYDGIIIPYQDGADNERDAEIMLRRISRREKAREKIRKATRKYLYAKKIRHIQTRESQAALYIQKSIRRKLAMMRASRMRLGGLTIQRMMHNNRRRKLAKDRWKRTARLARLAILLQARVRGVRARRMFRVLQQELREEKAVRTLQRLYRRKFHRSMLSDVVDMALDDNSEDGDDVMILSEHHCRPPIEHCRGFWVTTDDMEDDVEGLVVGVDLDTQMMVVEYGDHDHPDEYEISYNSPQITMWYRMFSRKEQMKSEWAATKLQCLLRGRIARKRVAGIRDGTITYVREPVLPKKTVLIEDRNKGDTQDNCHTYSADSLTPSEQGKRGYDVIILQEFDHRPAIGSCHGHWVETKSYPGEEGEIVSVNMKKRELLVKFENEREPSIVSYDSPDIVKWFYANSQADVDEQDEMSADVRKKTSKPKIYSNPPNSATKRAIAASAADDQNVELVEMTTPPSLDDARHHWIVRAHDPQREWFVDSVNTDTYVMSVLYDEGENVLREEFVSYYEPKLTWLEENTTKSRAPVVTSEIGSLSADRRERERTPTKTEQGKEDSSDSHLLQSNKLHHVHFAAEKEEPPSRNAIPGSSRFTRIGKPPFAETVGYFVDFEGELAKVVDKTNHPEMLIVKFLAAGSDPSDGSPLSFEDETDSIPYDTQDLIWWMTTESV